MDTPTSTASRFRPSGPSCSTGRPNGAAGIRNHAYSVVVNVLGDFEFDRVLAAIHQSCLSKAGADADVLLPVSAHAETSGTYVNGEGRWQSFSGVANPVGEARPGWKVLRVLANQFGLDGFEQGSSEEIRDALREQCGTIKLDNTQSAGPVAGPMPGDGLQRIGDTAIHGSDALVRRARSLQATPDAESASHARVNAATAQAAGVDDGASITLVQGKASASVTVEISERVPDNCVWCQTGTPAATSLGAAFGSISIERT